MLCPKCNNKLMCIDSRPIEEGTRRRKVCVNCGERISTYEIVADRLKELKRKEKAAELKRRTLNEGMLWDYCESCGNRIEVGDVCYDIADGTSLCLACVTINKSAGT